MEQPTEVFTSSYTQCTWFFVSSVAGTAGNCGNVCPKSEKDFSSSYPQSIYRCLLHCQSSLQHRGKAWRSTQEKKKVLTHNTVSLSPFTVKPQNAKPADRIPQTALQSDSGLLSFAAYQNYFHTIPAFFWCKIRCPFPSPSKRMDEWQVSASTL